MIFTQLKKYSNATNFTGSAFSSIRLRRIYGLTTSFLHQKLKTFQILLKLPSLGCICSLSLFLIKSRVLWHQVGVKTV